MCLEAPWFDALASKSADLQLFSSDLPNEKAMVCCEVDDLVGAPLSRNVRDGVKVQRLASKLEASTNGCSWGVYSAALFQATSINPNKMEWSRGSKAEACCDSVVDFPTI
jgi:hypothetical protein